MGTCGGSDLRSPTATANASIQFGKHVEFFYLNINGNYAKVEDSSEGQD